ncbi:AraC family transcriptional regulator [Aquimarina sp. AD10]|uniref:helix-turn-helix domain-containing protein n=1 Tax=Aquimarina sp. AD10 TaxID=1714849 RepID=UPI001313F5E3|nr:helix-turn-helix domain-containing protein [Aquimarina sp. AD10]
MHARQLILFLFLCSCLGYGQSFKIPDSLASLSYEEIQLRFYNGFEKKDSLFMKLYAQSYLKEAKKERILLKIVKAYNLVVSAYYRTGEDRKMLVYLDSAITASKLMKHRRYPALLYIHKANAYGRLGDFDNLLKSYLEGLKWCEKRGNKHLEFIIKHNIGTIKRSMRKYNESKSMFKECLFYRSNKKVMSRVDSLNYISSLYQLIKVYIETKQIDSANILNNSGYEFARGERDKLLFFKLNEAILNYYNEEYKKVIEGTNRILSRLHKPENKIFFKKIYVLDIYFHQAKSYEALGDMKNAIQYYLKIDSIAETKRHPITDIVVHDSYRGLIEYYKSRNEKDQQLLYINKLIYSDSVFNRSYRYENDRLSKEYDIPNLLQEKQQLIASLKGEKKESSNQVILVSLFLALSLGGTGYYYYKQQRYKQRFKQLVAANTGQESTKKKSPKNTIGIDAISKETLESLLAHLQKFEENQGYLVPKINAKDLAKQFGSNSSYLSVVVNTYKQKSLSQYISDLRIDYAVKKLQEDPKFRKYTIKAIAQEVGFNTAEAFAKAFYKKTGIYPSYFIKKLGFHDNA